MFNPTYYKFKTLGININFSELDAVSNLARMPIVVAKFGVRNITDNKFQ